MHNPDHDPNLFMRIMNALSGARESIGSDITHNIARAGTLFSDDGESALSAGRKLRAATEDIRAAIGTEISEHPTRTALELSDVGDIKAIGRGLIEGDPLEFGLGAAGAAMGPFGSAGIFRRIIDSIKNAGKTALRGADKVSAIADRTLDNIVDKSPTINLLEALNEKFAGGTPPKVHKENFDIALEELEFMELIRIDKLRNQSLLEQTRRAAGTPDQRNRRIAETMGGPVTESNAPLGIPAPTDSEIAEINRSLLARTRNLLRRLNDNTRR